MGALKSSHGLSLQSPFKGAGPGHAAARVKLQVGEVIEPSAGRRKPLGWAKFRRKRMQTYRTQKNGRWETVCRIKSSDGTVVKASDPDERVAMQKASEKLNRNEKQYDWK